MQGEEFSVSQRDALKITGLSRITFFRRRRLSGMKYLRDKRSGRIYYREFDVRRLKRYQTEAELANLFKGVGE